MTAISDVSAASLVLQNTTLDIQIFEFQIPEGSDLTLSPHVDSLPAGATVRVLLRYCPRADTDPPCPGAEPGHPWSPQHVEQPSVSHVGDEGEAGDADTPSSSTVSC